MKTFIALSLFCGLCCFASAQKIEPILEKVMAHYESQKEYELMTTYSLYRGHTKAHVSEQYTSTTIKNSRRTYITVLRSEIIQESGERLVVDHDQKSIHHQKTTGEKASNMPLNYKDLLRYYELEEYKEVEEKICLTLKLKQAQLMPTGYKTVKLYIDSSTHALLKQELFSNLLTEFINEDGTVDKQQSLLIIEFEEKKPVVKAPKISDYLKKRADNTLYATQQYQRYTIIENEKQ